MLYVYRQMSFANDARYREAWAENKKDPSKVAEPVLVKPPSMGQLGHIGRGLLVLENNHLVKEANPPRTAMAGMLGGVLCNILERNLNQSLASYWALIKRHYKLRSAGQHSTRPSLPGYTKGKITVTWGVGSKLQVSPDKTKLSFPGTQSLNNIVLPELTIPVNLRAGLRSGESTLVSITIEPLRDGRVKLTWTTRETGRGGIPYPEQPTSLLETLAAGPVASVDLGVRNLMAVSYTDLQVEARSLLASKSSLALPAPGSCLPGVASGVLPGPSLVRGTLLTRTASKHNHSTAALKKSLPYPKGGKKRKDGRTPRKNVHKTRYSSRMDKTFQGYENRVDQAIRETFKPLQEQLLKLGVKTLIVGWNKGIKTDVTMGRRNNRRFGSIPFDRVKALMRHWCERHGVLYVETPEGHTSKTSFYDAELPVHHDKYMGRRATREIFTTASGVRVNADVNASLQILVKYLHSVGLGGLLTPAVRSEVRKRSLNPVSIRITSAKK